MSLFDKDHDPLAERDALQQHIERALATERPSGLDLELLHKAVRGYCNPSIHGANNIPRRPCLFVGNHSLFALDGGVLIPLFLKELQRFPRPMGDRFLFSVKPMAEFLQSKGLVMGHPAVCDALMEDGQDVLVFPGGAFEAVKPAALRYELQWKERLGFVRQAARHGYTIVPFGLVGPDEFYNHVLEGRELPDSLPGKLLKAAGLLNDNTRTDIFPPLPIGALGTLLPKPQRCYLGFGEPIDLSRYKGKSPARKTLLSLRRQVAEQIESQLDELLALREEQRKDESLLRRVLTV